MVMLGVAVVAKVDRHAVLTFGMPFRPARPVQAVVPTSMPDARTGFTSAVPSGHEAFCHTFKGWQPEKSLPSSAPA